jgi:hypothetical protein
VDGPRSLTIYFELNLFLKSHQKPPYDALHCQTIPLCPRIINTHLVCSLELLWESFLTFLQTDSILNRSSNSVPRTAASICLLISRPLRVGSLRYELPPLALGRNLQRWTSLLWTLPCIALCHSSIGSAFGKLLVHVGQTMFTIQSLYYLISCLKFFVAA